MPWLEPMEWCTTPCSEMSSAREECAMSTWRASIPCGQWNCTRTKFPVDFHEIRLYYRIVGDRAQSSPRCVKGACSCHVPSAVPLDLSLIYPFPDVSVVHPGFIKAAPVTNLGGTSYSIPAAYRRAGPIEAYRPRAVIGYTRSFGESVKIATLSLSRQPGATFPLLLRAWHLLPSKILQVGKGDTLIWKIGYRSSRTFTVSGAWDLWCPALNLPEAGARWSSRLNWGKPWGHPSAAFSGRSRAPVPWYDVGIQFRAHVVGARTS